MIPPSENGSFVAGMENVLDVYKRPYDSLHPVVCMDESPKQLIGETRVPIPVKPGRPARHDYEYRRNGTCNIFMACEPLAGKRMVKITGARTRKDWAYFIEEIADHYQSAKKITLVMDNLNTHGPGSLYETFPPEKAKTIMGEVRVRVHPEAWKLAERGRDRAKRACRPMPEQED